MAIVLLKEKECRLSTQERYDIIDFAMQAAEDNGFMNSFIFERAIWLFAAIRLCEDRRDEIASMVAADLLEAWSELVADGTIEEMQANFADELEILAAEASVWFDEYTTYAHSARGLLSTIQSLSGDIVANAAKQFQSMQGDGDFQQVLDIAQNWGMNNRAVETDDSLFAK